MKNALSYSLIAAAFVSACATSQNDIVTEPLTAAEISNLLVGKTYPLGAATIEDGKGALYFSSASRLDAVWEGSQESGGYEITDQSSFCYNLQLFGGKECITLLRNVSGGGYVHTFESERRFLEEGAIVEGKAF